MNVGPKCSQHSKMKKELAGLQPADYSYGRCIPMNDVLVSPWNFSNTPDEICIPCGNTEVGSIDVSNCHHMVDTIDDVSNVTMDETLESASLMHDKDMAIFGVSHMMIARLRIYYPLMTTLMTTQ